MDELSRECMEAVERDDYRERTLGSWPKVPNCVPLEQGGKEAVGQMVTTGRM